MGTLRGRSTNNSTPGTRYQDDYTQTRVMRDVSGRPLERPRTSSHSSSGVPTTVLFIVITVVICVLCAVTAAAIWLHKSQGPDTVSTSSGGTLNRGPMSIATYPLVRTPTTAGGDTVCTTAQVVNSSTSPITVGGQWEMTTPSGVTLDRFQPVPRGDDPLSDAPIEPGARKQGDVCFTHVSAPGSSAPTGSYVVRMTSSGTVFEWRAVL